jgi:hypothetical protein
LIAERMAELTGQVEGSAPTGELFWAVRRLFEALARRRPLVIVLEDIHWAEPTLLDLIEYLAAWTIESPLLLVCLARPELHDERPALGANVLVLRLEPLAGAETDTLVGELAGAEVGSETRERIAGIAEGNPLFVEQLLAVLREAGPGALESVPPSVEALLASRLDRLEPEERGVLERAAIAGREFARAAVVQLTPPDEVAGADGRLRSLVRRGLIHALRSEPEREGGFRFHHVLIRDVAYAGITKERRRLHERFAAWPSSGGMAEEIVGYHLEQAHRYGWSCDQTSGFLSCAASRSASVPPGSGPEARRHPATVSSRSRRRPVARGRGARRSSLRTGIAQRFAADSSRARRPLPRRSTLPRRRVTSGCASRSDRVPSQLFSTSEWTQALLELAATAIPPSKSSETSVPSVGPGATWAMCAASKAGSPTGRRRKSARSSTTTGPAGPPPAVSPSWRRRSSTVLLTFAKGSKRASNCLPKRPTVQGEPTFSSSWAVSRRSTIGPTKPG